jgi:hypothetical protein
MVFSHRRTVTCAITRKVVVQYRWRTRRRGFRWLAIGLTSTVFVTGAHHNSTCPAVITAQCIQLSRANRGQWLAGNGSRRGALCVAEVGFGRPLRNAPGHLRI